MSGKLSVARLSIALAAPVAVAARRFPSWLRAFVASWLVATSVAQAADIGTAFTYQGHLESPPGMPVSGSCDFEFSLFSDSGGGTQVGVAQAVNDVPVSGGVFTVGSPDVDFGDGAFNGQARWLRIRVCCPTVCAPGELQALTPLIEVTAAPHAQRAVNGVGGANAINVTADEKVGIGTAAPTDKLDIRGSVAWGDGNNLLQSDQGGSIELGGLNAVANPQVGGAPYLDFHYGLAVAEDFNIRLINAADDRLDFRTDTATVMTINGSNVGIGTITPLALLHVSGDQVLGTSSATGTSEHLRIRAESDSWYLGVINDPGPTPADTDFYIGQFEGHAQLWIQNDGNVGIGTSSPQAKLHIEGDQVVGASGATGTSEHIRFRAQSDSWYVGVINDPGPTPADTAFYIGQFEGHPQLWIENGGDVGLGTSTPDTSLHVATGTDATLSNGAGYVVLGSVAAGNLVLDTNEIIARNNGVGAALFINNEGGNVGILRNSASHPLHVGIDNTTGNGAHLTSGGTWTNGSSRDSKQNFEDLDKAEILRQVIALPVSKWQYKGEGQSVHHVGPVAEDFRAAFGLGHDERYITTIDADGVALAAIQGLYEILREKDCEIEELREQKDSQIKQLGSEISNLQSQLAELKGLVSSLAQDHYRDRQGAGSYNGGSE
jgi:hypothetical protein